MSFIMENAAQLNIELHPTYVDTVGIARVLLPHQAKHTLDAVAKTMGVSLENHHRAVDDAEATAEIFVKFIPLLEQRNCHTPCGCEPFGRFQPGYCKETVFLPCDYPCEKRCWAGKSVPSGIGVSSDLLS